MRAQQRPAAEVERPPRPPRRASRAASPPRAARQRAQVDDRQRGRGRRQDDLHAARPAPSAKTVRSASCRRAISPRARASTPGGAGRAAGGRRARCRPSSPARAGGGTRAAAGRRRAAASPVARRAAAAAAAAAPAARRAARRAPRQPGRGRRREQRGERQLDAEGLAHPRDQPGGEQRVAAEREEVVVGADPLDPQQLRARARRAAPRPGWRRIAGGRAGRRRLRDRQGVHATTTNQVTFTASTGEFRPYLGVYTGSSIGSLTEIGCGRAEPLVDAGRGHRLSDPGLQRQRRHRSH